MNDWHIIAFTLATMALSIVVILMYISKKVQQYEDEMMQDYMKEKNQDYIGEIEPEEVDGSPV